MNTSNILSRPLIAILFSLAMVFTLAACEDGPAESTGAKMDQMVKDTGNAIEDACEKVKEGANAKDTDC